MQDELCFEIIHYLKTNFQNPNFMAILCTELKFKNCNT